MTASEILFVGFIVFLALVLAYLVYALMAAAEWNRDFKHDKALLEHDQSGELHERHRRL